MKQEDKELLLRYLCMALPYGVIINTPNGDGYLNSINQTVFGNEYGINIKPTRRDYFNDEENNFKPYLRPMSSMTEEELEELNCLCYHNISVQDDILCGYICGIEITDVQDFLLRYHFDFMDLIPKGLAIKVAEENNPYNITEE